MKPSANIADDLSMKLPAQIVLFAALPVIVVGGASVLATAWVIRSVARAIQGAK